MDRRKFMKTMLALPAGVSVGASLAEGGTAAKESRFYWLKGSDAIPEQATSHVQPAKYTWQGHRLGGGFGIVPSDEEVLRFARESRNHWLRKKEPEYWNMLMGVK